MKTWTEMWKRLTCICLRRSKGMRTFLFPKLENSTKTLICCVIMRKKKKKAFMHTHKKLYPFVHIVSVTFDHIPRKSACHSVWLRDKRCSYLQTVIELRRMIRLTYVNFVFSSYLPLMFLFSKLLPMLELVSLFSLDIHYHRLSGCLCFCECECLKA